MNLSCSRKYLVTLDVACAFHLARVGYRMYVSMWVCVFRTCGAVGSVSLWSVRLRFVCMSVCAHCAQEKDIENTFQRKCLLLKSTEEVPVETET